MSYSRADRVTAVALEAAIEVRGLTVWPDERSLTPGLPFTDEIENGIRSARGVVVLVTEATATTEWVTYEYAFAKGAGIPIVAAQLHRGVVPKPLQRFQIVPYSDAITVAEQIDKGLAAQSRSAGMKRATSPTLVAKFIEHNGDPVFISTNEDGLLQYQIEFWLEQVPSATTSVSYEIPDEGFRDRKWTVKRKRRQAHLTKDFREADMDSYGDVQIWARGSGRGAGSWSGSWRLYEALIRHYRGRPVARKVRQALRQIRDF